LYVDRRPVTRLNGKPPIIKSTEKQFTSGPGNSGQVFNIYSVEHITA